MRPPERDEDEKMKFIVHQYKDLDLTIHEATEQIDTYDIISALKDFYGSSKYMLKQRMGRCCNFRFTENLKKRWPGLG